MYGSRIATFFWWINGRILSVWINVRAFNLFINGQIFSMCAQGNKRVIFIALGYLFRVPQSIHFETLVDHRILTKLFRTHERQVWYNMLLLTSWRLCYVRDAKCGMFKVSAAWRVGCLSPFSCALLRSLCCSSPTLAAWKVGRADVLLSCRDIREVSQETEQAGYPVRRGFGGKCASGFYFKT